MRGNGPPTYVGKGANISPCGKYRYRLWREWRGSDGRHWDMFTEDDDSPVLDGAGHQWGEPKSCVFVMLNPSTADANEDDPTIRRCVGYAKAWGYDRLEVVNLFAWRATDPSEVLAMGGGAVDPVGVLNQDAIQHALNDADMVVCAWGAHGGHLDQDETVLGWIESYLDINDMEVPIMALKRTKDGFPSHPLYLRADAVPFPYSGRAHLERAQ